MFLLSKIMTHLILPPGSFILLLLAILLFAGRLTQRMVRILLALVVALIYLLSIQPVADRLILPLENKYPPLAQLLAPAPEAIVVLSGGLVDHSPELSGRAALGVSSLKRLMYAYLLARTYPCSVILSGGSVFNDTTESEASVMAHYLQTLGLSPSRLLVEPDSQNTLQNAGNTQALLKKHHVNRIVLVTSAYHMPRSVYCFSRYGVRTIPAATDYMSSRTATTWFNFIPSNAALNISYTALHEYIGMLYYHVL